MFRISFSIRLCLSSNGLNCYGTKEYVKYFIIVICLCFGINLCPPPPPPPPPPFSLRCFTAFPDSNVFEVGDQIFNIRVRASTSKFAASGKNS